jgi:hypothetical protein
VWNSNVVRDQLMGRHKLPATGEIKDKVLELDLYEKGKDASRRPGKLFVQVSSSSQIASL